jgi:hypothetical protein
VPPPTPVFPDGTYKLSAAAYEWANTKVAAGPMRAKAAAALAASLRGVASQIAAGTVPSLLDGLSKTKIANASALAGIGVANADWDAFGTNMQQTVYGLYTTKKLNSAADLAVAWNEIAAGLEQVK